MTAINLDMTLNRHLVFNGGLSGLCPADLILFLKSNYDTITYASLFKGLESATTVVNEVIYRTAILNKDVKKEFSLTIETAEKKADNILLNRRKRFIRRIWKKSPLFAMQIIKERYVDYTEDLLISDLTVSRMGKTKFKKNTSQFGLRISQIQKLSGFLKYNDLSEVERGKICNKIVGYTNGLKLKTPIILSVKYKAEVREYSFKWNETEAKIKTFVRLTKSNISFSGLDADWNQRFAYNN